MVDDDDNEGLEMPSGPPQLDADRYESIDELMLESPKWDDSFGVELSLLCRQHVVVRSAIMFAMELGGSALQKLRTESEIGEIKMAQGALKALEQYTQTMIDTMKRADEAHEEDPDVEE